MSVRLREKSSSKAGKRSKKSKSSSRSSTGSKSQQSNFESDSDDKSIDDTLSAPNDNIILPLSEYKLQRLSFDGANHTLGFAPYDERRKTDVLEVANYVTDLFQHLYHAEVSCGIIISRPFATNICLTMLCPSQNSIVDGKRSWPVHG